MKPPRRARGVPNTDTGLGWQGQHPNPAGLSWGAPGAVICAQARRVSVPTEHPEPFPFPISHLRLGTALTLPRACAEGG